MQMLSNDAKAIADIAKIRPLKRVEYDRLAAEGFFEDERVELLFGMVVEMSPPDPEHNESVEVVRRLLERQIGARAQVRSQCSFAASDESEPEPDVFVIPNGNYWHEHPARAFLIVEIARSSLRRDRVKQVVYANAPVDEYWIVDHHGDCVHTFSDAKDGTWGQTATLRRGEVLAPRCFPDVRIPIDEILPPRRS